MSKLAMAVVFAGFLVSPAAAQVTSSIDQGCILESVRKLPAAASAQITASSVSLVDAKTSPVKDIPIGTRTVDIESLVAAQKMKFRFLCMPARTGALVVMQIEIE